MGGLRKYMPQTFWTFMAGSLALAGIFPLAGFWSKDEILASLQYAGGHYTNAQGGDTLANFVLVVAIAGAFVTAFYMTRAISLTFFGKYKGHGHPHESPKIMTYPLIGLAFFSVTVGVLNMPGITSWFTDGVAARFLAPGDHHATSLNVVLALIGTAAAVGGIIVGYFLWFADKETQQERDRFRIPVLYPLLEKKYYIDDFYMDGLIRPIRGPVARAVEWFNGHVIDLVLNGAGLVAAKVAKVVYWFDQRGVDVAFNASAAAAGGTGGLLRLLQTGRVQQYAFLIVAGTVILVAGFIIF